MGHKRSEWSLEEISYFGLQAYWGATKHGGALKSTRDIIEYLGY